MIQIVSSFLIVLASSDYLNSTKNIFIINNIPDKSLALWDLVPVPLNFFASKIVSKLPFIIVIVISGTIFHLFIFPFIDPTLKIEHPGIT